MKIAEFISQSKYSDAGKLHVAGYFEGGKFYYLESDNKALPSAIHFLETLSRKKDIYTNLGTDHWLRTYNFIRKRVKDCKQSKAMQGVP